MTQIAMPEWLQRNDAPNGAWSVESGQPVRGDAWTDIGNRTMRVPTGTDENSRVIRAHEMMHARVSPTDGFVTASTLGITLDALRSAEEYRVNTLIGVAGFNLDHLSDGSESTMGKRRAESNDWNSIVLDVAAMAGTKSCADYIRGLRSVDADLAKAAREVEKHVVATWTKIAKRYHRANGKRGRQVLSQSAKEAAARIIGDTNPDTSMNNLPTGFTRYTVPLARLLEGLMHHPDGGGDEADEKIDLKEIQETLKAGTAGTFARMILGDLPLTRRVDGKMGRRKVASNTGRNPRRISRMMTDPERRVFDRKVKGKGGIVLIDLSGSMCLEEKDLWAIIEAAPGCTIIGYSHRSGSSSTPNVWVIADRGKVCETLPEGNGGNGVDGPAVRFAASKRRNNEPFIWVCDGMVTDGASDMPFTNLSIECVKLVNRHGIHMVRDVEQSVAALRQASRGRRLETTYTGPLLPIATNFLNSREA